MRKLNCSRRSLSSSSPRSLGCLVRKSFAFMYAPSCPNLAFDERRRHGQLRGCKAERLARDLLAHALDLEQHLAGQHFRHPILDVALAGAHAHFERLLRNRHIREYPYPNAPAALHVARNGAPRCFDFASSHAASIGRLQAEFAERNGVAALRAARNLALELFAELGPLRLHHVSLPNSTSGRRRGLSGLGRGRRGSFSISLRGLDFRLIEYLALEYPNLDTDDAVRGLRFGDPVVDIGTERVQRNAPLTIGFRTSDFRAIETPRDSYFDAQRTRTHGVGHRTLHGAAEHHPLFQLLGDAFGDKLGVEFGLANFGDVEPHVV